MSQTAFNDAAPAPEPPACLGQTHSTFHNFQNKFTGGVTNIRLAIQKAGESGRISFFPYPQAREPETLELPLPDAEGNKVQRVLARMQSRANEQLKQGYAFSALAGDIRGSDQPPALEDYRRIQSVIHNAVAAQFRENPFFRYHTSEYDNGDKIRENPPVGRVRDLSNLGKDLERGEELHKQGITEAEGARFQKSPPSDKNPWPQGVRKYPFDHVCQCETLSIMHGVLAQKLMEEHLGKWAGDLFYTAASSNYRLDPQKRVEHNFLTSAVQVRKNDGTSDWVVSMAIDPARYDLGKTDRRGVDRGYSDQLCYTRTDGEPVRLADFASGTPLSFMSKTITHNGTPFNLRYETHVPIVEGTPKPELLQPRAAPERSASLS